MQLRKSRASKHGVIICRVVDLLSVAFAEVPVLNEGRGC